MGANSERVFVLEHGAGISSYVPSGAGVGVPLLPVQNGLALYIGRVDMLQGQSGLVVAVAFAAYWQVLLEIGHDLMFAILVLIYASTVILRCVRLYLKTPGQRRGVYVADIVVLTTMIFVVMPPLNFNVFQKAVAVDPG